ncbi:hypothetical protein [Myroides marinus]|uniref:hypothetical protein n=1 Tax=Myroides marinus TaxID=703342 RepID=UPI002577A375|nr:hypothetical protein [Myroides marinus]MDM1361130.1 hypothetical protein [Myroides marinus]
MNIKSLQLHKRSSYEFKYIQDRFAYNLDKKTIAIADGTTQSFNSERWADVITQQFVSNSTFNLEQLVNLFKTVEKEYSNAEYIFSDNFAKAALEREKLKNGSTATFLGVEFYDDFFKIVSCGDSNLFRISNSEIVMYPFHTVEELDNNECFLNTVKLRRGEVDDSFFCLKEIPYLIEDKIILATDALSRLFLKQPDTINQLLSIKNFEEFHDFCIQYWETKELEEDDITAVIISFEDDDSVEVIIPNIDFSFPKEEEYEFIPSHVETESSDLNSQDMQEIRQNFNGVAKDFFEVKKSLKSQQLFNLLISSLLIVNLLFTGIIIYKTGFLKEDKNVSELTTNNKNDGKTNQGGEKKEQGDPKKENKK